MSKDGNPVNTGDFIVEKDYPGYVFMGWADGRFEAKTDDGTEKRPYHNMYVISPVSSYQSEDFKGFGFKAEKKSCLTSDVWKDLQPGDRVRLFFDDKGRVQMIALES